MTMNNILKTIAITLIAVVFCSCEKDKNSPDSDQLDVNYATTNGIWSLSSLNGSKIAGDAFFIISLDRKESEFDIYDNMSSGVSHHSEGAFSLDQDEDEGGMVISGTYYNSFSRNWDNDYLVISLTADTMVWKTVGSDELQLFQRIDAVPGDILAGTRSTAD